MASKKTAAELKQEAAALSDQFANARKKPLNFAWLIGKEGLVLETDLKKSPDVLWRTARKNGGGSKGAQGQISVTGKTIRLICDSDEAPTQLPKLVRRFLSERGLAYSIVLITPSGEFADVDGEAADDDAADAAAASQDAAPASEDAAAASVDTAPALEDTAPASEDTAAASQEAALRQALLAEFDALSAGLDKAVRSRNSRAARKAQMLADRFRTEVETDLKKSRGVLTLLARTVEEAVGAGIARDRTERRNLLTGLKTDIDALLATLA